MNKIKCKFCDWETSRWRTNKQGKRKNGYLLLRTHVEEVHPEEWNKIQQNLHYDIHDFLGER